MLDKLQRALANDLDRYTVEDVLQVLESGGGKAWWKGGSVIVTREVAYPQCRDLVIWLATGQLYELAELYKEVEEYARKASFDHIEVIGRKGWVRLLPQIGFRPTQYVMTKAL